MRRLYFLFIALISFLFIINGVFLRRTISILLCGVLSFNSASCYSFLDKYGAKATAASSSSSVAPLTENIIAQKDKEKVAGCFLGICPPQIPPLPGIPSGNLIEAAETAIIKQVGESLGLGSPLLLDQHTAFPQAPDITDFHPKELTFSSVEDLYKPLPPGDYKIYVIAYCNQFSIHAPGRGLPYKLARMQGKQAPAISALLTRGTLQHIPPASLNADAWRIQAGLPLTQWPPQDKDLIHKLIPEYEQGLQGDYLQQIEDTYNQYRLVPGIPSFDDILKKAGELGHIVLQLRQARQVLSNKTIAAERLPDMLYESTNDGLPRVLPPSTNSSPSPWAEVRPGVFARFTVIEGNLGKNLFEFRITPEAKSAAIDNSVLVASKELDKSINISQWQGIAIAEVLGIGEIVAVGVGATETAAELAAIRQVLLQAFSIQRAAQVLSIVMTMVGPPNGGGNNNNNGEPNKKLTASEAAKKAEELGYTQKVKDPPFDSHGQPVFTNGKDYITPDVDSHNGGVWKMFNRAGQRTGTYDGNLNRIGK